jgi:hypothetical protein
LRGREGRCHDDRHRRTDPQENTDPQEKRWRSHLWDTDPDRVAHRICATAGDQITDTEWAKYVPGAPYQAICP